MPQGGDPQRVIKALELQAHQDFEEEDEEDEEDEEEELDRLIEQYLSQREH